MLGRRIFWKLFLSFWAALLLFAFGVLYAASAYLDSTREHYHNSPPRERSSAVFAAAQKEAHQGFDALKAWAQKVDHAELVPQLLLDAGGRDILGRTPSERALVRLAFVTKNYAANSSDR